MRHLSTIVAFLFVSISVAISQPETSAGCRVGHEFLYPGNVTVFNLGSPLNSEYSEYNAVISQDESYMLFTSRSDSTTGEKIYKVDFKPYEDMMISSMKNRTFESAVNLEVRADLFPFNINTAKHEAPVFLGKNDSLLIIYKEDKLWFSTLSDTGYSQAKLYPNEINKGDFQPHGSITEDDSIIYFSSEVVDKKNNHRVHLDIFMSKRNKDGGWSKPEALPEPINSLYNEDSPNVCYAGSSLFFASDRPNGFGGYDVYFTEIVDGAWSGPELLCEPINSGAHDIYFTLTSSNRYAFFSSNRLGGLGNMDIYKVVLNPTEFGDCVDQDKSARVENDSAMYNGLIIEGRDTTGVGVPTIFSAVHSTMSKKRPDYLFWHIEDIRKEGVEVIGHRFEEPGTYIVQLKGNLVNRKMMDLETQCVQRKIVVLSKDDFKAYKKRASKASEYADLIDEDEVILAKGAEPKRSNGLSVKNDWVTTTVNTPIRIHPLDNDRHESGAEISISKVERASVGTAVIDDNDVLYIPPKGFEGYDKFTYSASANNQESPMATVIINIVPEKKFLEGTGIVNGSASGRSGEEISIDLKSIAQLGTAGAIIKVGKPYNGFINSFDSVSGVVKYQSKEGFVGQDAFTYYYLGKNGEPLSGVMKVRIGSDPGLVNTAPDMQTTDIGAPLAFDLFGNDIPTAAQSATVIDVSVPQSGRVQIVDAKRGIVTYYPATGYIGTDAFTYTIQTEYGIVTEGVNVIVGSEGDRESVEAVQDYILADVNETVELNLLTNDKSTAGSNLWIVSLAEGKNGKSEIVDKFSGIVRFTPNNGFVGKETLAYEIKSSTGLTSTSTLTIEFSKTKVDVASGLALKDDVIETQTNTPITFKPLDNDKHQSERNFEIINLGQAQNGTAIIDNKYQGIVFYLPNENFEGEDEFMYEVIDSRGFKASAKIVVKVLPEFDVANIQIQNLPKIDLEPIFFDYDDASILNSEHAALDRNIEKLKQDPSLVIKVVAHCDSRGSNDYNLKLSTRRAESTVDYMIANGISKSRILAVLGMGESQLTNDCGDGKPCNDFQHRQNRRSEFEIVGRQQ